MCLTAATLNITFLLNLTQRLQLHDDKIADCGLKIKLKAPYIDIPGIVLSHIGLTLNVKLYPVRNVTPTYFVSGFNNDFPG